MSLLQRLFGGTDPRAALLPLYRAVVDAGRDPGWYRDGGVPDTLDGRFDILSTVLALVLLRMEDEAGAAKSDTVLLTETFIEDMDGTLRQIGIGDHVVGKHVGGMMSVLGGRLGAFREAGEAEAFREAVRRNVFRDSPPSEEALDFTSARLLALREALASFPYAQLIAGRLPAL